MDIALTMPPCLPIMKNWSQTVIFQNCIMLLTSLPSESTQTLEAGDSIKENFLKLLNIMLPATFKSNTPKTTSNGAQ